MGWMAKAELNRWALYADSVRTGDKPKDLAARHGVSQSTARAYIKRCKGVLTHTGMALVSEKGFHGTACKQ